MIAMEHARHEALSREMMAGIAGGNPIYSPIVGRVVYGIFMYEVMEIYKSQRQNIINFGQAAINAVVNGPSGNYGTVPEAELGEYTTDNLGRRLYY